jgi:hypothetical protein
MSELINARRRNENLRRNLLTNASMLALLGYLGASTGAPAAADEDAPPTVWIELGGQLERVAGAPEIFSPPFLAQDDATDRSLMTDAQASPPYSIGGESRITYVPQDTDWVFSAEIRYGRSNGAQHVHHQPPYILSHDTGYLYGGLLKLHFHPSKDKFGDAQTKSDETHSVLDFRAGKDVGLGLFGAGGKSVVSAGVRYAQFSSSSDATLHARPVEKWPFVTNPGVSRVPDFAYRTYTAVFHAARNTHAVGPSLSWDASASVMGHGSDMRLAFDWGANAAVLFGRQRAQVHHQTTGYIHSHLGDYPGTKYTHRYTSKPANQNRARAVTIPNVGGFADITFQKSITKISFGYRADFFFGAMDGGIDTTKKENVGFYGPFASVSVGLGG